MISSANKLCEHYKPKYSLKVYFEPKSLATKYFSSIETSAPPVDIYLLRVDGTNRFTPAKFRINAAFVSTLKACKDKLSCIAVEVKPTNTNLPSGQTISYHNQTMLRVKDSVAGTIEAIHNQHAQPLAVAEDDEEFTLE
jgi:hypothetical protein